MPDPYVICVVFGTWMFVLVVALAGNHLTLRQVDAQAERLRDALTAQSKATEAATVAADAWKRACIRQGNTFGAYLSGFARGRGADPMAVLADCGFTVTATKLDPNASLPKEP